ncbi:MAG: hypothetical protein ABJA67_13085 [Chthonomonadales bacterium]
MFVRIVSVPDGKLLLKFDNHSDWIFATAWAKTTDIPKMTATANKGGRTNRAAVPEDTQHLLSTGRDAAIKLVISDSGSFVDDINTHTSAYRAMVRHPNENQVLVGGDDGVPRIYQVFRTKPRTMNQEDHNLIRAFDKLPGQINAVAFSPDGKNIVVGGEGGEVRIYRVSDGMKLATFNGTAEVVFTIAYRPDGKQIAVGGLDGKIRLLNADSASLITAFEPVKVEKRAAAVH